MTNRWGRRRLAQGAPIMSETSRIVGTVFQVVYGLTTPATVLAILIVTLLGALGVVDMDWVVTEERAALAYMVAFGTFALSPALSPSVSSTRSASSPSPPGRRGASLPSAGRTPPA